MDTQVTGRVREPGPSIYLEQQLVLFYRENGQCTESYVIANKTGEDGVYSVFCKYTKKCLSKFYFQMQELTNSLYQQDHIQFLISASLVNRTGPSNNQYPKYERTLCATVDAFHVIPSDRDDNLVICTTYNN